jgi:nitrite reductase/ring-hydroxylating ferredoxin subunit
MLLLCTPDQLAEGRSRGFSIQGQRLLAVRKQGRVHAYRNRCPHRGIALEWEADRFLDASGGLLQCAQHGALFLIESGECIQGPCQGEFLEALSCQEDERGVWVDLPSPEA